MCNIFVPNLFILGAGHWGHFPLVWASNQLVARSIRYKGHLYKGQLDKIAKCTKQFIRDTFSRSLPGSAPGCRSGNGEKLSSTQAESGQAIKSAVAFNFPPFPVRHPGADPGTKV